MFLVDSVVIAVAFRKHTKVNSSLPLPTMISGKTDYYFNANGTYSYKIGTVKSVLILWVAVCAAINIANG